MKILVGIKRVVDYQARVRVLPDGSAVDLTNVKMSMNPFDEIAVEEAIRLKEKGLASEIVVISIGQTSAQETLRTALAMGADRALLLHTQLEIQPLAAAKLLQAIVKQESPSLVLLGKQAIDTDDNQVGQMLAGLLNWPQATFVSALTLQDQTLQVTREIDGGLEMLTMSLPAVVTVDLRLNEPRYLSLPNIVQAKRKPLTQIDVDTLAVEVKPRLETVNLSMPVKARGRNRVDTVTALVDELKKAQVLI